MERAVGRYKTDEQQDEQAQLTLSINQCQAFFGKKLDAGQVKLWLRALRKYDLEVAREALMDATEQCHRAPRPRDVLDIIDAKRAESAARAARRSPEHALLQGPPPDPQLARDWSWVIRQWGGSAATLFSDPGVRDDEIDGILDRVNRQCAAVGHAQALPEHCYLPQHWGGRTYQQACDDQVEAEKREGVHRR